MNLELPNDAVPDALYRRHLGLPTCAELDERVETLAEGARRWFAEHAEPFATSHEARIQRIVYDVIHLQNKAQISSALLAGGFARAGVDRLIVVGLTAGKSVDERIDEYWRGDRPDKAMFLNAYAIAAVEHWRWHIGDQLRHSYATSQATVLPHYSPGYDGWGLKDQSRLFKLLFDGNDGANQEDGLHNPIRLLESGGLLPHKTTLTVYGVTPSCDFDAKKIDQYWSCRVGSVSAARSAKAKYGFPEKTLKKWRDKRLKLKATTEKTIEATFRFDGTTCTSLGVPLSFEYTVRLENEDGRYKIQATDSRPVANEIGYQSMCGYLDNPERFMAQFDAHRPLVGHFLDESLTWQASLSSAGCLCSRPSQDHKWRIVFQTINYALEDHE